MLFLLQAGGCPNGTEEAFHEGRNDASVNGKEPVQGTINLNAGSRSLDRDDSSQSE